MITEAQLEAVVAHAEADYPKIACGLLFADGTILRCENVARDSNSAEVWYFQRYRAARCGEIIGCYYSRKEGPVLPLAADYVSADEFGKYYVIASVRPDAEGYVTQCAIYKLAGTPEAKLFEHYSPRGQLVATFCQRT